jgi:predicted RNase H-like nuclease (RuvC/YqgF family)
MNKPKPEDVMRALECWVSKKPCEEACPIHEYIGNYNCISLTMKNALALIRELTEEIARLTEDNERLHASCTELERKCASLTDDNEKLIEAAFETVDHAVDVIRDLKKQVSDLEQELSKRPPRLLITRKP